MQRRISVYRHRQTCAFFVHHFQDSISVYINSLKTAVEKVLPPQITVLGVQVAVPFRVSYHRQILPILRI